MCKYKVLPIFGLVISCSSKDSSVAYGPPSEFPIDSSSTNGGEYFTSFGGSMGGQISTSSIMSGSGGMGGSGGEDQTLHDLCLGTEGIMISQECCPDVGDWTDTCKPINCGNNLQCEQPEIMTKICDCMLGFCFDQTSGCIPKKI